MSEETFPNNLGHLVSRHSRRALLGSSRRLKLRCNGACLPGTSRGCRNSVTPDALSFSSLRLTRVTVSSDENGTITCFSLPTSACELAIGPPRYQIYRMHPARVSAGRFHKF